MATVTITIDTDNDAFGEDAGAEVGRILRVTASRAESHGIGPRTGHDLYDYNGNKVGHFTVEPG